MEEKRVTYTTTIKPSVRTKLSVFVAESGGQIRGVNDVIEYLTDKYLSVTTSQEVIDYMKNGFIRDTISKPKKQQKKQTKKDNIQEEAKYSADDFSDL